MAPCARTASGPFFAHRNQVHYWGSLGRAAVVALVADGARRAIVRDLGHHRSAAASGEIRSPSTLGWNTSPRVNALFAVKMNS